MTRLFAGAAIAMFTVTAAMASDDDTDELPPYLIAVSGSAVPRLVGSSVECLRATAVDHDGARHEIPVQVDERWRDGDQWLWAFERGEEPRRDPDPTFDADDLLLLDVRDAGVCTPTESDATTIEVADGGCIVLRCDPTTPPVAPRVQALAGDLIAGRGYRLGFAPNGQAWLNDLRLGGGPNLLDRSKARLRLELPLGLVVDRNEDDVRTRVTGEHAGPLRIVREMEARGRMALGLYSRPTSDRFVFYADGFSIPTSVVISPTAAMLLGSIALRLSMDLRTDNGLEFRSAPEVPAAIPITGHEGQRGGSAPLGWYLLRSGDIGLLGWLETDAAYAGAVTLYYNDDVNHPDPPENVPGELGDHGFFFVHEGDLAAGTFRVITQAWVVSGDDLDDPAHVRARFRTRPSFVVR